MTSDHTFQRLAAAGFSPLLPIIPHDATISRHSKALRGREDALGKIPGKRVEDGWVGLAGWESYAADAEDLATWDADGAGVGLRCSGVVAVDIDVTEPALVRIIRREVITWLGFGPARTGNAPKVLLLFRLEDEDLPTKRVLSFLDYHGQRQAIELLGARQQFVVAGTHPKTRRPYSWDEDLAELGREGLPAVRLSDLEAFVSACIDSLTLFDCEGLTATSGQGYTERTPAHLRAGDLDLLADTVRGIPNDEANGYQELTTMAHAIRSAADADPERGLDILQEWSERWPHGADADETARIYWSIHGSSIGAPWLFDQARAAGVDTVAADFGEVAANDASGVAEDPDDDSWWSRYVYVNHLKRFVDRRTGVWLDKEQFNDRHREPDAKKKPADLFLEYRRPYSFADATDYCPGRSGGVARCPDSGRTLFNTWRPGPAHSGAWDQGPADDMAVRLWLRLAEHVVPDPRERDTLLDWMAHLIQHPGVKPSWHPLLGSTIHGTGKDSLFAPLVKGLGHNARTIQATDLEGEWTWWAEDVQLVVVSEMHSFERRAIMNKLKSLMAAPPDTIGINRKGVAQYDVRNTFGMVMFSNNEDAVALEKGDRRFFVLWGEMEPLEPDFYERYHAWLSNGGAAAVCRWLAARSLAGFDAKGRAPDTEAKVAMRQAALSQVDGLLAMGIEDEQGPFRRDLVTLTEILDWLRSRVRNLPSPHKMASVLKTAGCASLGRARIGEERERLYACRRAAMYARLPSTKVRNLLIEQREQTSGASADFAEDRESL